MYCSVTLSVISLHHLEQQRKIKSHQFGISVAWTCLVLAVSPIPQLQLHNATAWTHTHTHLCESISYIHHQTAESSPLPLLRTYFLICPIHQYSFIHSPIRSLPFRCVYYGACRVGGVLLRDGKGGVKLWTLFQLHAVHSTEDK